MATPSQSSSAEDRCQFCTLSITGNTPTFQSIFVCRSCTNDEYNQLLCLCQACADNCHADHDGLEHIGMGPCYCDCRHLLVGCRIQEESDSFARQLLKDRPQRSKRVALKRPIQAVEETRLYRLFEDSSALDRLQKEAVLLTQQSKDTFWLDADADPSSLTELESLAGVILKGHALRYDMKDCGAEWWVQVKQVSTEHGRANVDQPRNEQESVDLHYDKDEVIAEHFGIGSFPLLSTVTYLTNSGNAPPTVIFAKRYDQSEEDPISDMFVSYPRQGNHLVFDGTLLHGAPVHYGLRRPVKSPFEDRLRITFLVNIWDIHHRPAGVRVLPDSIRQEILSIGVDKTRIFPLSSKSISQANPIQSKTVELDSERDLPESSRERLALPFLGATTTWESASDDGSTTMVVTYPPPIGSRGHDGILLRFGEGMEAYVENDFSSDEEM